MHTSADDGPIVEVFLLEPERFKQIQTVRDGVAQAIVAAGINTQAPNFFASGILDERGRILALRNIQKTVL